MQQDVIVIGGGIVGSAIAYGLVRRGARVLTIDGNDRDFRASTANFGLVWQQGKGMGMPAYQRLTRASVRGWHDFSRELQEAANIELQLEQNGGLTLCVGEEAFAVRRRQLEELSKQLPDDQPDWEMIDRATLERLLPDANIGRDVTGASYGRRDGHVNPLRLLVALREASLRMGASRREGASVRSIVADGAGYAVQVGDERIFASRVVIAAGLGSKGLAADVGIDLPIRPLRGQILVTERLAPFLPLPTIDVRQTADGTVMAGSTQEEVGYDGSTTGEAAAEISAAAVRSFPDLASARLVRQWGGLRIMTPDGYPIYETSDRSPGVFVAQCHSGVTLAAFHATSLAEAIMAGRLPPSLEPFHQRRFDVQEAA